MAEYMSTHKGLEIDSVVTKVTATIDASKTSGTLEFGTPFNNGLAVVIANSAKCTIIYE